MANDESHDTRTTVPEDRVAEAVSLSVAGVTGSEGRTNPNRLFTFDINARGTTSGVRVADSSGKINGKDVFQGDAFNTYYSDEVLFNGDNTIKMSVASGNTGFGSFGGTINLGTYPNGAILFHGDELWIRSRIYLPAGFEYNLQGRNKFLRLRVFHEENGAAVSEGYNDLYIDGSDPNGSPWAFIFEGRQQWLVLGTGPGDALEIGKWHTIEMHLVLDNLKGSEGGSALVQVWFDDRLLGESSERATLKQVDSYMSFFYYFTYWDNLGAHRDTDVFIESIVMTSEKPLNVDAAGNHYLGKNGGPN